MRVRSPSRHHPPRMICAHRPAGQGGMFSVTGVGFVLAAPFLYAAMGFIIGVIGAAIYDVIARRIGGIEVEVA